MKNNTDTTISKDFDQVVFSGDPHGSFARLYYYCIASKMTDKSLMILLGDVCVNYFLNDNDLPQKRNLALLPCKVLIVHGNHEARAYKQPGYTEQDFCGGKVYVHPDFPNQLFAKDGSIFHINGVTMAVCGGAYSVDKWYRIDNGLPWFEDEQPDEQTRRYVEEQLAGADWKVDLMLTHTCPHECEPRDAFIKGICQGEVDKTVEHWFDEIKKNLDYKKWLCGHFHIERSEGKMEFLFENYLRLEDLI